MRIRTRLAVAITLSGTYLIASCNDDITAPSASAPLPVITGVTPTMVVAGEIVTISGSNFGNDPGQVTVMCSCCTGTGQVLSVTPTSISVRVPLSVGNCQIVVTIAGRTAVGPTLLVIRNVAGTYFMRSVFVTDFCDLLTDAEEDEFVRNVLRGPWSIQQNGVQLTVTHDVDTWTGVLSDKALNRFEARIVDDETTDLGLQLTFLPVSRLTGALIFIGKNPGHVPRCDITISLTGRVPD